MDIASADRGVAKSSLAIAGAPTRIATRRHSRRAINLCLAAVDAAAILAGFGAAELVACVFSGSAFANGLDPIATIAVLLPGPVVLAWFAAHQHYSARLSFWRAQQDILIASIGALLAAGCIDSLLRGREAAAAPVLVWLFALLVISAGRRLARQVLSALGLWLLPTLLIGRGDALGNALWVLGLEASLGYRVVAVIDPDDACDMLQRESWSKLLGDRGAAMAVLAGDVTGQSGAALTGMLMRQRVPFAVVPQWRLPVLGMSQTRFFSHDAVLFLYRNNLAQPIARAIKLTFDLLVASIALLALLPVFLLIAVAVKWDGGPVFYSHLRVGARGRSFRCLKFRSMRTDGNEVLTRHLVAHPEAAREWAATRKLVNDPRVTPLGRFLRATSLDECPQLLNVLRLEMSLVGPRPIVRAEVPRYGEDIAFYYQTRPGLTGLWQVSGRTGTSYEHRVRLDAWYAKNWTLWHDLAILTKTVPAVLARRGAV